MDTYCDAPSTTHRLAQSGHASDETVPLIEDDCQNMGERSVADWLQHYSHLRLPVFSKHELSRLDDDALATNPGLYMPEHPCASPPRRGRYPGCLASAPRGNRIHAKDMWIGFTMTYMRSKASSLAPGSTFCLWVSPCISDWSIINALTGQAIYR